MLPAERGPTVELQVSARVTQLALSALQGGRRRFESVIAHQSGGRGVTDHRSMTSQKGGVDTTRHASLAQPSRFARASMHRRKRLESSVAISSRSPRSAPPSGRERSRNSSHAKRRYRSDCDGGRFAEGLGSVGGPAMECHQSLPVGTSSTPSRSACTNTSSHAHSSVFQRHRSS